MKKKSEISVRKAVEMVFREMGQLFHAPQFCKEVKARTGRYLLMDGTILRRLREARASNVEFNYRVIDPETSLYRKSGEAVVWSAEKGGVK